MATALKLTVRDSGITQRLAQLQARLGNLQPAMQDIGDEFAERIRQQFSRGQDPYGNRWQPLSAATQAKNNGKRSGGQPLRDTGRLQASISATANANSVRVGTSALYATTHQFGAGQGQYGRNRRNGPIPWGTVPARPYMPIVGQTVQLPPQWVQAAQDIIAQHLNAEGASA